VQEQICNLLTFCAAVESQIYFDRVTKALVGRGFEQRPCPTAETFQRLLAEIQTSKLSDGRPQVAGGAGEIDEDQWGEARVAGHQELVPDSRGSGMLERFGTKLTVFVQKLQGLRYDDATAKAIIFVQFDELRLQAAAALREAGIPTAQLKGSASQRASVIRDWQENPDSRIFVLLLSLSESASGTNLTAGSHIVFLHPMLASTEERAAAQELQAIGRARRHGQARSTLHVWRFVAANTVEEPITQRHLKTLSSHEADCTARIIKKHGDEDGDLVCG
jgi:SNF2 family DNA or RNA helicase